MRIALNFKFRALKPQRILSLLCSRLVYSTTELHGKTLKKNNLAIYTVLSIFSVFCASLSNPANSGGLYDMSRLINEPHPFENIKYEPSLRLKKDIAQPIVPKMIVEAPKKLSKKASPTPISKPTTVIGSLKNATTKASPTPILKPTIPRVLPEILVTATRIDVGLPGSSVTIIDKENIKNSALDDLSVILGQEAGIQTRDFFGGLNGTRATIDIRGFGSVGTQNSLILIDGRRLNDIDLANVDLGKIPIENIERIEIIRGNAGAVLYGDGAVGGVINFVTKAETEKPTEANLEISYGSERRKEIKFSTSKRIGGYSSRVFLNSIYSDGFRDNNNYIQRNFSGEVKKSGNQGNIFIKLGLDDSSLGLPGGREVNRPAGIDLVSTDPTGTTTPFDIALQNGIDLTIGGTYQLDNNTELILDAGMKRKDQDSTNNETSRVDTDLTTYSFTPRANTKYSIGPLAATTKFGLDYYYANYNSDRKEGSSAVVPDDRYNAFQQSIAPYAQNTLALTPKTDLSFGLRFQHVNTVAGHTKRAGTGTTQQESLNDQEIQWAANLGLNHKITNFWNVFYRLGRSMRIPTIDERIGSGVEDTNFKLNTQTSNDAEIGFEYTSKNLSLHSSAWSMYIKNEIAFNSQAVAFGTNVNYDPTRRYGFENNAVYKVSDQLKINGNLNFIHAEFREGPFEGNDIPLVSPWTASSGLLWNVFGEKLTLSATLNWWDRKYLENDERNIFEKIPSATVADLKVGGQLNSKNYGHAIWSAKVNNVFDESYYNYGVASATSANKFNAFPLPGRTFLLTAGWKY